VNRKERRLGTKAQPAATRGRRPLGFSAGVLAVALVAAATGAWWAIGSARDPDARPNIVLVTLDTTRADRIGAYGYQTARTPTLDRLASTGVLFERAVTQAPTTLPAHASIFTGRNPPAHGVRNNGFPLEEDVPTIASALQEAGYRTGAFVSAFVLDRRFGLSRGFDVYDDRLDPRVGASAELVERRGDRTVQAAVGWLSGLGLPASGADAPAAPFFLWLHLFDPHDPYEPPAPFRDAFADSPYDGEIAFADSALGALIGSLERLGVRSSTIVAVIGDHGESLGDHHEATHGMFLYEPAMRVPALLSWPARLPAGMRVAPLVRAIDLAPTLMELAGVPRLEGIDGESLMPLVRGGTRSSISAYGETYFPELFMNWSPLRSIRDDRWKFIEAPEPELYDLTKDPGELTNLATREPARTAALRQALAAFTSANVDRTATMDRETLQKLAALGYLSASTPPPRGSAERRPDPKAMIGVFNRLRVANAALMEGRVHEAAAITRETLASDGQNAFAMLIGAKADMARGHYHEAAGLFRQYLEQVPTSADAHHWLAICHLQLGDERRALTEVDAALAIDSRFAEARALRGDLLAAAGQVDEGVTELRAAVALNPNKAPHRVSLGRVLFRAGKIGEAEVEFRRATELQPDSSEAHSGLGAALADQGDLARAVTAFERALSLRPARHEVRLDFARALEALGRGADARAEYERLASDRTVPATIREVARRSR
jgi:choline-sulfatase